MTIAKKPNGVAIVTLDAPGEKMNTLNEVLAFESAADVPDRALKPAGASRIGIDCT